MTTVLPHPPRPHSADSSEAALRELYRDHAPALLRYAQWFTDDRASAEDAVQETFLRAWRHLPRLLADGRPLRPWLRQVLRHVLIDAGRTARAHREHPARGSCPSRARSTAATSPCSTAGCSTSCCATCRRPTARCWWRSTTATRQRSGSPPGSVSRAGTVRSRLYYALRAVREPARRARGGRPPPSAACAPRNPPGYRTGVPCTAAPQWRMPTGAAYRTGRPCTGTTWTGSTG